MMPTDSSVKPAVSFVRGRWYKTNDGHKVKFVRPIEQDGMYNVFRHVAPEYRPYYTDVNGRTAYGSFIES